ncbi:MAG TPA: Mur ligase family protein, partial [Candidatus Omnitrophota bacterium]|nr:Mur ligase family protein [Candidatus Omnitrophota bacterium]
MTDFKGKKVTVAGLAKSGMAAALLLKKRGAVVWATDSGDSPALREHKRLLEKKGIAVEIGGHSRGYIRGKDLVVISPGVPEGSPVLKWAGEYGVPAIGEIELGYLCCEVPIVAVTGTNGKSTTTTLIGEILRRGGRRAVVCGNIGNPFCGEIGKTTKDSVVVLEVSSFQLESV